MIQQEDLPAIRIIDPKARNYDFGRSGKYEVKNAS
jgi:hypothetical protein